MGNWIILFMIAIVVLIVALVILKRRKTRREESSGREKFEFQANWVASLMKELEPLCQEHNLRVFSSVSSRGNYRVTVIRGDKESPWLTAIIRDDGGIVADFPSGDTMLTYGDSDSTRQSIIKRAKETLAS